MTKNLNNIFLSVNKGQKRRRIYK